MITIGSPNKWTCAKCGLPQIPALVEGDTFDRHVIEDAMIRAKQDPYRCQCGSDAFFPPGDSGPIEVPLYQAGELVGTQKVDPYTVAERGALLAEIRRLHELVTRGETLCKQCGCLISEYCAACD